ncbi:hypothetical protein ACHAWF_016342 [Thalassiosira exigua]
MKFAASVAASLAAAALVVPGTGQVVSRHANPRAGRDSARKRSGDAKLDRFRALEDIASESMSYPVAAEMVTAMGGKSGKETPCTIESLEGTFQIQFDATEGPGLLPEPAYVSQADGFLTFMRPEDYTGKDSTGVMLVKLCYQLEIKDPNKYVLGQYAAVQTSFERDGAILIKLASAVPEPPTNATDVLNATDKLYYGATIEGEEEPRGGKGGWNVSLSVLLSNDDDDGDDDDGKNDMYSFRNDTIMFHVGKAGGGTIYNNLNVHVKWVHPRPTLNAIKKLQTGPARTLIINVRDPVDRFVSAFNWRLAVLCHPGDKREKRLRGAARHPRKICSPNSKKEEVMLRQTYKYNPNTMAEALCKDSRSRTMAVKDFKRLGHSRTLTQWLKFLIEPSMRGDISDKGIHALLALPLEKRANETKPRFEEYIHRLGLHLLETRFGKEVVGKKAQENEAADEEEGREEDDEHDGRDEVGGKSYHHSSSRFFNSTTQRTLTPLGECCLVRYLKDDYRLIRTMLGDMRSDDEVTTGAIRPLTNAHPVIRKACAWGGEDQQQSCREDLTSILMRRARYLGETEESCSSAARTT